MACGVTLLVCALATGTALQARDTTPTLDRVEFHVRASDPQVRAWIRNGAIESRTLQALLAQLAESDIIVHVELVDRIAGGADGQMYFVTAKPTVRYLRIEIVRPRSHADTIALIAHELQHAAEVADAPRVRDSISLSTFYLGMRENAMHPGHYDSVAARITENIVKGEVMAYGAAMDAEVRTMARLRRASQRTP